MLQPVSHKEAHLPPHLIVVGTDKGRELLRVGLTLEYDDRYAAVVGAVDGRRDGLHLVGSHNQQVDAGMQQTVYLLYLPLVAVVGSGKAQLHPILEIRTHAQFRILLLTPDVGRTLRDSYHIARFPGCAANACHQPYKQGQNSQ